MPHTPGTWIDDKQGAVCGRPGAICTTRGVIIADNVYGNDAKEADANARLISFAPELLETAKEVVANWESYDLAGFINSLREVIENAEAE